MEHPQNQVGLQPHNPILSTTYDINVIPISTQKCVDIRYCLKATSQTNDYLCSYRARTRMRLERRNALNLSLYSAIESVSKLGSRRKPVCG